ncbi:hypothetical protein ASC95_12155 [Pelomonas sp. Root1217]|uniref:hypothetical protein n=1 Tax=Pelomonas sp. Root1217 TaxID=1736430 RepID=UPI00070C1474|nr:hypothetical protein [Pelomonas sp. Root1217]KQV53479.1 hypothetical protein ASC95_12155 [Pelomonas sp. Root1217]
MNPWLVGAAALVFVIGLAHSWLGERMVFRHLRAGGLVPVGGQPALREFQTRILWASWHVVTALAWALAVVLAWLAQPAVQAMSGGIIEAAAATALAVSGGLVLLSNRGRHPAWIALLAAAALVLMSQR